jgi:hypothetical protein
MEEKQMSQIIGLDPEMVSSGLTSLQSVMELLENAKQAYLPYRDNCTQVFGEELGAEVFDAGEKLLTGLDEINETTDSIVGWGNSLKEGFISTKDTCKEMFLRLK